MFHGSIPADMCRIVREHVSLWTDVTDVYNVCCHSLLSRRLLTYS
ncbi:hypothetical protein [Streptomyces sp. WAC 04229]